jgi:hypothetical protein
VPIYSADPRCGLLKRTFARSPLTVMETDAASTDALPVAVRAVVNSISLAAPTASRVLAGPRFRKVPTAS